MNKGPEKCWWCKSDPLLEKYHDTEWGVPVHNDTLHFEYLLMESMSCGLSWTLMLRKREVFRACFAAFDYHKIALFNDSDIERIINTEGMIRSLGKIKGIINNAQKFIEIQQEYGSFDRYIWHFTHEKTIIYQSHLDGLWETKNALSDEIAKDLKKRGFKFMGSVILYSHLQGIGIINDHQLSCFRYRPLSKNAIIL
ncbi:MAG: DNA-3-methyladenine glycosylase I [Prevotella sp.]|jgi:DNA-3-methyladenine glycosylase I|nr:DNA-3-methyladenine glycosylase I [Prevotella sp.]MCI1280992.1 DNA-3-methyladenine glycosylase I [Prevotella sp.]